MKLLDLNRHGGIGASCHLLQLGDVRIIIDSGLHPKQTGPDGTPDFSPLDGIEADLIIITHCHLDHIGSLPLLLRRQLRAPVVMTASSAMLIGRMLHNSVSVMERQREEQSRGDLPLFTHEEVDRIVPRFHSLAFGQTRKIAGAHDDVEVTLHPAGHVAGAAGVELKHKGRRIFFTGDVLFDSQRTVPGARFPAGHFDTIVIETTRGATERAADHQREAEITRLVETINKTIGRGGSVLIPVFALGRHQELLTIMQDARSQDRLAHCPVYSSGLGIDLCDYFDDISRKTRHINFSRSVLKSLKVQQCPRNLIPGVDPRLNGIFLLSSGMVMENTPSYIMASCIGGHAHNTIAFVGYSDPDTPGGRIQKATRGEKYLFEKLDCEVKLNCDIERFELSGHADREQLVDFALRRDPRVIVLNHGDPEARCWFAAEFASAAGHIKVVDPKPMTLIEV
jgi:Cft2 family RNA processing exonuclease